MERLRHRLQWVDSLGLCREASRKASLLLDSTVIDETRTPLKLPQFEMAVMIAATRALETWRDEALEGDTTLEDRRYGDVCSSWQSCCSTNLISQTCSAHCAVARTIVYMEQGYVTAAFFRHRMYERYRNWEQERQLGRMLDEGGALCSLQFLKMAWSCDSNLFCNARFTEGWLACRPRRTRRLGVRRRGRLR